MKPQETAIAIDDATAPTVQRGAMRTFIALVLVHAWIDCYGGFWPMFKKLADLDLSYAGVLATVTTVFTMSLQPVFGIWADQGRRRRYVLIGFLMTMTGMLLGPIGYHMSAIGDAPAYLLMLIILLVVRIGQAMFHPAGASIAGTVVREKRSTFVSIFIAGGMLGYASSHMLFAWTYKRFDGNTLWLLLPGILVAGYAMIVCRPSDKRTGERPRFGDLLESIKLLRTRLWILFAVQVLLSAQALGTYFLLPEFLESHGCPTWLSDGGGFGLMVGGSVFLMIPAGQLADRFGRRKTLVCVLLISLICYYALVTSMNLPVAAWCALLLISGGLIGTANPLGVALGQHLLPEKASLVSGMLMGLAWAIGGTSQWIVGLLAENPSLGPAGALMCLGVTNMLSLLLALALPASLTKSSESS